MGEVVVVVPWVGVFVQLSLEVEVGMVVVGKLDRQESQNCKQRWRWSCWVAWSIAF